MDRHQRPHRFQAIQCPDQSLEFAEVPSICHDLMRLHVLNLALLKLLSPELDVVVIGVV